MARPRCRQPGLEVLKVRRQGAAILLLSAPLHPSRRVCTLPTRRARAGWHIEQRCPRVALACGVPLRALPDLAKAR